MLDQFLVHHCSFASNLMYWGSPCESGHYSWCCLVQLMTLSTSGHTSRIVCWDTNHILIRRSHNTELNNLQPRSFAIILYDTIGLISIGKSCGSSLFRSETEVLFDTRSATVTDVYTVIQFSGNGRKPCATKNGSGTEATVGRALWQSTHLLHWPLSTKRTRSIGGRSAQKAFSDSVAVDECSSGPNKTKSWQHYCKETRQGVPRYFSVCRGHCERARQSRSSWWNSHDHRHTEGRVTNTQLLDTCCECGLVLLGASEEVKRSFQDLFQSTLIKRSSVQSWESPQRETIGCSEDSQLYRKARG